jgi:hypothetical protein
MQNTIGFPTQGELIQFIYDAAGVMPRKRGLEVGIDETTKKSIQTALSRLASEEGDVNNNFGKLTQQLSYLIAEHITNPRINYSVGEILFDVLDVYTAIKSVNCCK